VIDEESQAVLNTTSKMHFKNNGRAGNVAYARKGLL
jgi:hypothetical protein